MCLCVHVMWSHRARVVYADHHQTLHDRTMLWCDLLLVTSCRQLQQSHLHSAQITWRSSNIIDCGLLQSINYIGWKKQRIRTCVRRLATHWQRAGPRRADTLYHLPLPVVWQTVAMATGDVGSKVPVIRIVSKQLHCRVWLRQSTAVTARCQHVTTFVRSTPETLAYYRKTIVSIEWAQLCLVAA